EKGTLERRRTVAKRGNEHTHEGGRDQTEIAPEQDEADWSGKNAGPTEPLGVRRQKILIFAFRDRHRAACDCDAKADQNDAECSRHEARPHMHQGAEPITWPLEGHHQAEKYDQGARIKIALAHEVPDEVHDRALGRGQDSSTLFSVFKPSPHLRLKTPADDNQSPCTAIRNGADLAVRWRAL